MIKDGEEELIAYHYDLVTTEADISPKYLPTSAKRKKEYQGTIVL